ncbi:DoxX family protein [Xinfangfangia pollutisoli]|uniref:DoxX family protein n=1 Tax=Xinfangfangia pollutisoli TaxID=2865960 RepID=UPI001CD5B50D|nr:DoxX family protein [Xinfangfangia pollutisoli]
MRRVIGAANRVSAWLARQDGALALLARLVFAAVLLRYFWASALTKFGTGPFAPSAGAYAQIFPRQLEAVGYDPAALGFFADLTVLAGTWAEILLPALIVLGLMTRPAALAMAGFVCVQSLTDIFGHGAAPGAWFDAAPDSAIADQRAFWLLLLALLVSKGGGAVSADRLLGSLWRRLAAMRHIS